ncbi:uncharacterized protein BDR25DRAFT_351884 [Lindgomyces ingoldianus]|uniref:Uncharacterized protein n=1 Tax=Lindgomyces ingoldianus TaxID=673940 RepID=A0ACB6R7B4_9PLEO|nr:uncharacterized protein BDR25DRAFT_351884 [Lindgomyces ingoldianus]KAF2474336.1 hypothetical protein BDR25DRAFT_351884 [Lindgomyces ingoldianus]
MLVNTNRQPSNSDRQLNHSSHDNVSLQTTSTIPQSTSLCRYTNLPTFKSSKSHPSEEIKRTKSNQNQTRQEEKKTMAINKFQVGAKELAFTLSLSTADLLLHNRLATRPIHSALQLLEQKFAVPYRKKMCNRNEYQACQPKKDHSDLNSRK